MGKKKKICILGSDGYLGYSLAKVLIKAGHNVVGIDDGSRRELVNCMNSNSVIPIPPIDIRHKSLIKDAMNRWEGSYKFMRASTMDYNILLTLFHKEKPDAIIHLAEQPSAAYSLKGADESVHTQQNNVIGSLNVLWAIKKACPKAHLIKLGSMGEWGTQGNIIPELDFTYHKEPGSWYHVSKVHDSFNINFASRIWGLRCTDIMQGVVYGLNDCKCGCHLTRFDYDEAFGTVINRFIAQTIAGVPLTVYGKGGQTRGYLPIMDSMQCLQIVIDNPPKAGEHRIINQFAETYSVNKLAEMVKRVGNSKGLDVTIDHIKNPRKESEQHTYDVEHKWLEEHGYVPNYEIESVVADSFDRLKPYVDTININHFNPKIKWRN